MEKIQQYELTFILGEKASAEETKKKVSEIKSEIEKLDGKVTKEENWGRRELAYPIKKNRSGVYTTLWFDLPAEKVKPLEAVLRFDEAVIRSLVTKAYTSAQPGSLYVVVEEPKTEKSSQSANGKEETTSAEEMLRRTSTVKTKKTEEVVEEEVTDEERIKKLDESLEELLKDDAPQE